MAANGEAPDYIKNHPAMKGIDLSNAGRPSRAMLMVTKTLLFAPEGNNLFSAAAGAGGTMFRVLDKKTGQADSRNRAPRHGHGHSDDLHGERPAIHCGRGRLRWIPRGTGCPGVALTGLLLASAPAAATGSGIFFTGRGSIGVRAAAAGGGWNPAIIRRAVLKEFGVLAQRMPLGVTAPLPGRRSCRPAGCRRESWSPAPDSGRRPAQSRRKRSDRYCR